MSNFDFLRATLPFLHADCARAESYLTTDPRSACFYSRRAVEELVGRLYDVLALPAPYQDDVSARINDAGFKAKSGNAINQKLNLIRKLGNAAVHDARPIAPTAALQVLRELFHVTVWAAFHHSPNPDAVPIAAQFDAALAAKAAPLSRGELIKLAEWPRTPRIATCHETGNRLRSASRRRQSVTSFRLGLGTAPSTTWVLAPPELATCSERYACVRLGSGSRCSGTASGP